MTDRNDEGMTALMYACIHERIKIVKYLLDEGADINCQNKIGETSLMMVYSNKSTGILKLLLDKDADITLKDSDDNTVIHKFCRRGSNIDMFQLLLDKSTVSDLNQKNLIGMTALMYACWNGYIDIVEALLAKDVAINETNKDGMTALMYSLISGNDNISVVKALLKKGADVHQINKYNRSVIYYARANEYPNIISLITKELSKSKKQQKKIKSKKTRDVN